MKLVKKKKYLGKSLFGLEGIFHPVETVLIYFVILSCKWKPLMKLTETSSLYFL